MTPRSAASIAVEAHLMSHRGTITQIADATKMPMKQVAASVAYMRKLGNPLVDNVIPPAKVRGAALGKGRPLGASALHSRTPLELAWCGARL